MLSPRPFAIGTFAAIAVGIVIPWPQDGGGGRTKPAKVTHYSMKEIMRKLPETTDFPQMSTVQLGDEKDLA